MSPVKPSGVQQPELSDDDAIRVWLDALASGKCDESEFLQAMQERFRSNPEANWEALSQLDQHFRRGRISPETFRSVKTALAESALRIVNAASHVAAAPVVSAPGPMAAFDAETRSIPIARDVVGSQDMSGEPKPGSVLRRRYRLENLVGQGGTGPVFQAVDEYRLESPGTQRLAIKILHPAVVKRAELLAELRREFQTLQLLSHPNIVRVFEFDRDGSLVFFTMELLTGATLSRVLQARKLMALPQNQALAAIRDIGSALAYAHSRGVVHGDINPRSIFVTGHGDLRVLGFPGTLKARENPTSLDHELTLPMATSGYASCQALEGETPDTRDDVFSLACVAYLLLCGEHPLKQKTAVEARDARIKIRRPPHLSHRQWQALRAALRWERDGRPGDVQQWLRELDLSDAANRLPSLSDLLEAPAGKVRKSPWAAVAAVGALALLAGAYWFISQRGILPRLAPPASSRAPNSETTPTTVAPTAEAPAAAPRVPISAPASSLSAAASTTSAPTATAPTATPPKTIAASAPTTVTSTVAAAPRASASLPTPSPPPATSPLPATSAPPFATSPPATTSPSSAQPVVAAAGSSKVELTADTVDVPLGEATAQISVHRKGSLRGETSFTWWTESGTAKPGVDFSAVVPQVAHIGDGKSGVTLTVALSNAPHAQPKSFYVVIDQAEGGAVIAGRTLTMVTLQTAD
jgi:serine/threonine protein kinase